MATEATEATFAATVLDRSRERAVVVDFWAEWCGPCRALAPVLEAAVEARSDEVELVKVNTDENPALAASFDIRGIPAVKAFRDGRIVDEFVGAQGRAAVEAFVARLVPSEADRLVGAGDEDALRRAIELEPGRADARVALARLLLERGQADDAVELLRPVDHEREAAGLLARAELAGDPSAPREVVEGLAALDRGDYERALGTLLEAIRESGGETRDRIRRVMVGAFGELGDTHPLAVGFRRQLARALY